MGLWESALILLGIGIVSERFGAGVGLGELGTGIRTLAAAPLGGVGAGLGEFGGGLRTFAEALGDVGRGFGALFENIPRIGPGPPGPFGPNGGEEQYAIVPPRQPPLITVSGGDQTSNLAGGGGQVPQARLQELLALRGQYPRGSEPAQYWNRVINQLTQTGVSNV